MESLIIKETYQPIVGGSKENKIIFNKEDKHIYVESPIKYEFVDLGLPSGLKWAKSNLGARKEYEVGLYYQWGETEGYELGGKRFICDTYKYGNPTTKYNSTDGITVIELEDDACYAHNNMMRIPMRSEYEELLNNTTSQWITNYNNSGINGRLLTSKHNGKKLFLPCGGGVVDNEVSGFNQYGYLLSANVNTNNYNIWDIYYGSSTLAVGNISRCYGLNLRGVKE